MVLAENVCKRFGNTVVLDGVSLAVARGEVMCMIGPSGSGKTSFLRCINHLEKIDAGRLTVDGELVGYRRVRGRLHELRDREVAEARSSIGMVFQSFNLFPHMTALENVMVAPVHVRRRKKDEAARRGRELLAQVNLADKEASYPAQLSGGEQQRVAIARALAMDPKLMLFDEPTSALDPELVDGVLDAIRALAAKGMSMVIVTHEIGFARDVADTLVFMDKGQVLETGTPSEVINNPQNARTRLFLSSLR